MTQETNGELSEREIEILEQVATGATNQQIALALHISVNTVKSHLRNIFAKLCVESRTEATLCAIQRGLIAVDSPVDEGSMERQAAQVPEYPTPSWMAWSPSRAQGWALLVALLLLVATVVWPQSRSASPATAGRLVDQPGLSTPDDEVGASSRWANRASMPTPRGRFAQAALDGMVYVIAGLTEEGWSARVEAYDPAADLWDHRAPKPTAVANVGAAVVDGLIYVPGGLGEENVVLSVLEVYDPVNDVWLERARLPRGLCAYAIVPYGQGFYLFGGWDGTNYLSSTYYYDAAADVWREEASLSAPRAFAAAALVGERIYVTGGHDGENELRLCESYSPSLFAEGQQAWLEEVPLKYGRAGHGAASVLGNLYVVGGGWDHPFVYNERYDIANRVWSTFDSPIVGEWRSLGISSVSSGEGTFLYVMGGWSGRYLSVVKAYQALFLIYVP